MTLWNEKEDQLVEHMDTPIGDDFPQLPPRLGQGNMSLTDSPQQLGTLEDLYLQLGNFLRSIDIESLRKAIIRVMHVKKQYELIPIMVLLGFSRLTRDQIMGLSVRLTQKLGKEYGIKSIKEYSMKSIKNAVSSVLSNESIISLQKEFGVTYYSLSTSVKSAIFNEYSDILSTKSEEENVDKINPEDLVQDAINFLHAVYKDKIIELLTENPSKLLVVEYEKVLAFSDKLAKLVKYRTKEAMDVTFAKALEKVVKEITGDSSEENSLDFKVTFTSKVTHKRLMDIDVSRELNTLITVEAKIMTVSKPLIFHPRLVFVCRDCGHEMIRVQDFLIPRASENKCAACGSRNLFIDTYKSKSVELLVFTLQDLLENLTNNEQPQDFKAFTIINTKKLMGLVGQKVKVTGVVRTKIQLESEKSTASEIVLEVFHVQELEQKTSSKLTQKDIKKILEFRAKYSDKEIINALIDSIAPTIYADREKTPELWAIKKSVLIALVSSKKLVNDQRKWINVLVIGDKGSGKSRILEDLKKVFHLELASGGGSTNQVGLIGMAKNDELTKNWVYRAGALARANGSVLLIDEFDKLREDDYKALHTVMSVGYYVFNKADLNLEVIARESIIVMANPIKGIISNQKSIFEQVAFSTTLLDRFDIIVGLRTYEEDEVMNKIDEKIWQATLGEINRKVSEEVLVKYIIYAQGITPIWDESAKQKLTEFVKKLRKHLRDSGSFSYSHRLLISMINISESIARLKLKDRVAEEDVDEAIELMTVAVKSWGEDVDFSLLSELSYDFTADQRRLLDTVEEVMKRIGSYYYHGVPREELVDALQEQLGSVDDARKAITLAMKVGIITKIGDNWMLTRDT